MAQLSDDCFAHGGQLMRLATALALIGERLVKVVGDEIVPLADSGNRILAEKLTSAIDVPGCDNSAVDGYAMHFDDLDPKAETALPVIGRARAGHPFAGPLPRGSALRIFTGALMPAGADTVLMQEDCRIEEDRVLVWPGIKRGANRRLKGEDIAVGQTVLEAGRRLRPQDLGLAAAIGRDRLALAARLRIGLFSTGDELAEPGQPLPSGAIYDSNRPMVAGVLSAWGCQVADLGILKDDRGATIERLAEAAEKYDLLVTSGGVSMGEEDHVRAAIEARGRLHFWKLAIKPGRPVAMGQIACRDGRWVALIGLPGNPVASFVTLTSIGRAIVFALMGAELTPVRYFPVIADFRHRKKPERREWVRASIGPRSGDGLPLARAFEREGAGILTSLTETDGLVELQEEVTEIRLGDSVDFVPFAELL